MKVANKLLGIIFLVSASAVSASDVEIEGAWVREAPPGMQMLAGYMVVENKTGKDLVMTGAESSAFGSIELHHTMIKDGMASMVQQKSVTIPAHGKFTFEPKGYHLMLMKPVKDLHQGDKVKITLQFSNHKNVAGAFPVRQGDGSMMHHHEMNHKEMGEHHMDHHN